MSEENTEQNRQGKTTDDLVIAKRQWERVRSRLRAELGEATFNSWFRHLEILKATATSITIQVPTKFIGSWIETNYLKRILGHWKKENDAISKINVSIQPAMHQPATQPETISRVVTDSRSSQPVQNTQVNHLPSEERGQDDVGAPLEPRYTFDNFVVGKSNEMAHAAARRITDGNPSYYKLHNPLFLYGGVGLGKTHLMHAIAWEIRRNDPSRRVIYTSAEKFMYQFIRALRYKDMMSFKQQFREVDVLMVDDIQFIAGKESTQEEFFHTFNALIDGNHQVIISADRSPSDLEGIEERIRSRLGWGLVADIHPTDYELRLGILQSKAETLMRNHKDAVVPEQVMEFLAQRVATNIRELEGALNRVVAFASFSGRPITLEMAKEILRDLLRASERRISIDQIQRKVADYYNVRMGDMLSARRSRAVARPRQIAMYLSKQLTTRSLPEIGRKFGGRDHTTVIHAVRKVESLRESDPSIEEDVDLLLRSLEA
ncbi:chromosomal replication initiator protein DnaA [Candidatus Micropelagos thuwalensis]|nr:chromosomal replication initiator protein DnaA [Candidatus Micropelagos thuwalensis]